MKTFLYGTTAMMAAAAVAGTASAQQAAKKPNEKITLQLGGYYFGSYVFGDESRGQKPCPIRNATTGVTAGCADPSTGLVASAAAPPIPPFVAPANTAFGGLVNEPGRGRRSQRVQHEGEVYFRGQTTLDNGLTVGAFVQLEALTSADQIDESYIYFSGSFGRVEYGSMDSVAEQMYYGVPGTILPQLSTVIRNTTHYNVGGNAAIYPQAGPGFTGYGDWDKVNYYTPRIAGFQFGISYAPETCEDANVASLAANQAAAIGQTVPGAASFAGAGGGAGGAGGFGCIGSFSNATNNGQQGDVATLGFNYVNKFGPVDVGAAFFWSKGNLEGPTGLGTVNGITATDRKEMGFGLNLSAYGFTIAGGWRRDNLGVRSNNTDRTDYNVGLVYRTGPWQFGAEYGRATVGQGIAGAGVPTTAGLRAGDDVAEVFNAGVVYTMAPGIAFHAGIHYFNLDDNFHNPSAENDGVIGVIGTRLDF
jgi:hypothetical protein